MNGKKQMINKFQKGYRSCLTLESYIAFCLMPHGLPAVLIEMIVVVEVVLTAIEHEIGPALAEYQVDLKIVVDFVAVAARMDVDVDYLDDSQCSGCCWCRCCSIRCRVVCTWEFLS